MWIDKTEWFNLALARGKEGEGSWLLTYTGSNVFQLYPVIYLSGRGAGEDGARGRGTTQGSGPG